MHHFQAKTLSRSEMLQSAKQSYPSGARRVHTRPVPRGAGSHAGTSAAQNFLGTTTLGTTLPRNSVTTFSFLHSIKDPFILRKEKLTMHNLHGESNRTNVIFQNPKFFPYALRNVFRLKRETSFLPCVYTFWSCNSSDVLTHL